MEIETPKSELKSNSTMSQNELSQHRTTMSEHRTHLADMRSHLANERTHLSYLRTGISLISFGVTLNRFSLYLIQNNELPNFKRGHSLLTDTTNIGIGMVLIGCALILWSIFHFFNSEKAIENADFKPSKRTILLFSVIVLITGAYATVWMIAG